MMLWPVSLDSLSFLHQDLVGAILFPQCNPAASLNEILRNQPVVGKNQGLEERGAFPLVTSILMDQSHCYHLLRIGSR